MLLLFNIFLLLIPKKKKKGFRSYACIKMESDIIISFLGIVISHLIRNSYFFFRRERYDRKYRYNI